MSTTEEWIGQAGERKEGFLIGLRDTSSLHLTAIDCLEELFERNPDRLRIGHRNIIIIGDLALYAIPVKPIMAAFLNPWANRSDLPRIEIHPLAGWVRHHSSACIQPPGASDEPGPDTIVAICEALLADRSLFMMEGMTTFRNALFRTYGYGISPITDVLTSFFEQRGAQIDLASGEIVVPGSYSWKWHLQFGDPDVSGFTLHSSIRDGPKRMHIIDTGEIPEFSVSPMDCINGMLYHLRRAPRSLLNPNDDYHDPRNSHEFRVAVARVWDPLRRRMEEQEAAEQAEQEAAEQEAVATLFPPSDEDEEGFIGNGNNAAAHRARDVMFQRMLQFDAARAAANSRNLQEE